MVNLFKGYLALKVWEHLLWISTDSLDLQEVQIK